MNYFMLAGISSNVGKTTVTMGIMGALKNRGLKVKPFKTGPDYIDPMFHRFVTGEDSVNLDTWMLGEETVRQLFDRRLQDDDVGVLEGVMGLYDGNRLESEKGSSAYLAKLVDAPVILIINGRGMAKSAAALVKGYLDFDPDVNIKGVIINRVSSESHYQLLKEMIEAYNPVTVLGYFPETPEIIMDSRHLGLVPVEELDGFREKVEKAAEVAEKTIDLDKLLEISQRPMRKPNRVDPFLSLKEEFGGLRIGIPRDRAFNFYYDDNLRAFENAGVELVVFSPIKDQYLPDGLDALYIGGGFPEIFGAELAKNTSMLKDIREKLEAGLPCYAECGGLMYLTEKITDKEGQSYEMVGFLKAQAVMTQKLQRFGYVDVCAFIGGQSIEIRGHEFHHSLIETNEDLQTAYVISKRGKTWTCGYTKNNVLAGYPHIHFYSNPEFFKALLKIAKKHRETKG
ncbi:MAG: cobyrinic acid a,c-diamide synthase [Eubacteriaceae bacterium]|nr:cobyrinic acid a,c-diamide synthase [Eubacteriaceae bacterium]